MGRHFIPSTFPPAKPNRHSPWFSHNFPPFSLLDSFSLSLSSLLRILPLGLFGTTSINSTPPLSHLCEALLFSTCCRISLTRLALSMLWREVAADLTMKALGSSPASSLGTGITAASATAGCVRRWASNSAGATWWP